MLTRLFDSTPQHFGISSVHEAQPSNGELGSAQRANQVPAAGAQADAEMCGVTCSAQRHPAISCLTS